MHKLPVARRWIIFLSLLGLIFSGSLVMSEIITGVCTQGLFCNTSACFLGFILFGVIFLVSFVMDNDPAALHVIRWVALVGIALAEYSTTKELRECWAPSWLVLPYCFYGLLLFLTIFILTFVPYQKRYAPHK